MQIFCGSFCSFCLAQTKKMESKFKKKKDEKYIKTSSKFAGWFSVWPFSRRN